MRMLFTKIWAIRRAVILYILLLGGGWMLGALLRTHLLSYLTEMSGPELQTLMIITLFVYVLTTAIPFVPGAEIGFALLMIFGAKVAGIVYLGMVGALILSFVVARIFPLAVLAHGCHWIGLNRAAQLMEDLDRIPAHQRSQIFANRLPQSFGQKLVKSRYLLFALAINTPGNTVIGGGGGLAFMAGISGLYSFWAYVLVVLCAVAPVPILFALSA